MKRQWLSVGLCLALLATAAPLAMGQNSKADKKRQAAEKKRQEKEWKNRAKSYVKNPIALKNNVEANKKQLDDLTEKNAQLVKRLGEMQADLEKAQGEVTRMQTDCEQTKAAYEALKAKPTKPVVDMNGVVFKVQIGAFKLFNLSKYLQEIGELTSEDSGEVHKYTLGIFRDLQTAENFRKDIRSMGIRDAWTVAYRDGGRITIKEAKKILGMEGSKLGDGAEPPASKAKAKPQK